MTKSPRHQDEYPEKEAAKRRDKALAQMLQTPPQPHKPPEGTRDLLRAGDYFLVRDGRYLIARPTKRNSEAGSITADLYRNLEDYRSGRVMERGFEYLA